MKYLFILNDPPYGTECCYNGLRLAHAMLKQSEDNQVVVFLMADAVGCARKGQKTPEGFYNLERMVKPFTRGRGRLLLCGTCMDARGLEEDRMIDGAQRSTMNALSQETASADKVLVF